MSFGDTVVTPAGPSRRSSHLNVSQGPLSLWPSSLERGPRKLNNSQLHEIQPEVTIIGAGIAGCALAYALSQGGRRVLLLERDLSEPDRIVGELLQPGGVAALYKLGLGHVLEGIDATPVEGYCVSSGGREVGIPYPDMERMAGVDLEDGLAGGKLGNEAINGKAKAQAKVRAKAAEVSRPKAKDGEVSLRRRKRNGSCASVLSGGITADSSSRFDAQDQLSDNDTPSLSSASSSSSSAPSTPVSEDPAAAPASWHIASRSGRKEGRSFHHGRLISSLRTACLNAGSNLTVLEATVRDLVHCEHTNRVIGVSAAFKVPPASDSAESAASVPSTSEDISAPSTETIVRRVYSPVTIVADGCFSKFRTLPNSRIPKPKTRSHFVGLILKNAQLPLKYHGNVFLTPSGPVLLYQIGDKAEETRMLVDVKGKLPSVADGSLKVSQARSKLHHS